MARFTTIVAVVSAEAQEIVEAVAADAMNVTAVLLDAKDDVDLTAERAAALRNAERGKNVYTLIDFDPMSAVVDAWAARLAGEDNQLELEVGRMGRIDLPEYMLIGDDVDDGRVHWYHGHLRGYAPRRVLTTKPTPAAVHRHLAELRSDRAFPSADAIARAGLDYSPTRLSTG